MGLGLGSCVGMGPGPAYKDRAWLPPWVGKHVPVLDTTHVPHLNHDWAPSLTRFATESSAMLSSPVS